MSLLRIKDNSVIKEEEFSTIKRLTKEIENQTLGQLEQKGMFVFPEKIRDARDLTSDQFVLQKINDTYYSSNVMGFVGYDEELLFIESRFSREKDYFFKYLLDNVLDFPNIIDLEVEADKHSQLFNFLLFLFPRYLKRALRKGLYKEYNNCQYNDENIKGPIDIARHIKKNIPFIGKVAYNRREFSYDNSLMQLIRHTIEYIRSISYGNRILSKVRNEIELIISATPNYRIHNRQKIININKKNPLRHTYFREYYTLQRLCLLILQYQKHNVGLGSRQIYGVLVDGAWLWEEYLYSLIENIFYHPMNKSRKEAQWLFSGKTKAGLVYPDFISKDSKNRIIADAKYKPMKNIGNLDYHQILAYMYRFDAKTGLFFYPNIEEKIDQKLWLNSGSTYERNVKPRNDISIMKHGLKIPLDAQSYTEFVEKMHLSEQEFKDRLVGSSV